MTEWPDWRGESVAIVASGPSAKGSQVELLRSVMRTMAIKASIDLCPWADAVYGCDGPWWRHRRGLPEFEGVKIAWDAAACDLYRDLKRVTIKDKKSDYLVFGETGSIGAGGNSGFQALNLAVQFGAKRILLIGYDMHDRSGAHWYGRNNWSGANNPTDDNFRRWVGAFNNAAPVLTSLGVDVINASPISALTCFKHRTVERAIQEWA